MATTTTAYTLDQYKDDKQKELERKRNAAVQEADVSFQKLQKYLQPSEAMARKGYSQGMTETAMIAANNSRQRAIAAADNDYSAAYTDLMNQYRTEKKAEQDFVYQNAIDAINNMEFDSSADLKAFVEGLEGSVGDAQYQELNRRMNYYYGDMYEAEQRTEANKQKLVRNGSTINTADDADDEGDNVVVTVNGKTYDTEVKEVVQDESLINDLKAVLDDDPKHGEVFAFDGRYYAYVNGNFVELYDEGGVGDAINSVRSNGRVTYNIVPFQKK